MTNKTVPITLHGDGGEPTHYVVWHYPEGKVDRRVRLGWLDPEATNTEQEILSEAIRLMLCAGPAELGPTQRFYYLARLLVEEANDLICERVEESVRLTYDETNECVTWKEPF